MSLWKLKQLKLLNSNKVKKIFHLITGTLTTRRFILNEYRSHIYGGCYFFFFQEKTKRDY